MTRPTLENPRFGFKTMEDANAFRQEIAAAGLRYAQPICWHDNNQTFPKEIVGASCFVLRFADRLVGVTAAHGPGISESEGDNALARLSASFDALRP